tara:strand:+ start:1259 stop:2440 length:1182 start_codon:yes stop_codon:yes gene_type:complete
MTKNKSNKKKNLNIDTLISIIRDKKLNNIKKYYNYRTIKEYVKKKLTLVNQERSKIKPRVYVFLNDIKININKLNPVNIFQAGQEFIEQKTQIIDQKKVELQLSKKWAQAILISIITGTSFGVGWLAFAKTDEVVIAQGKLEPLSKVVDIQMPLQGITKKILVEEGEKVSKGQLLIILDTEITEANQAYLKKNYETQLNILKSLKVLVKEGAISRVQYLEKENQINEIESKLIQNEVTMKYQKIISPINGYVFDLNQKEAGYVGNRTDPVMKIVPMDDLIARVEIDSQKIGFVSIGKKVDISIDSFPASDFGVLEGVLTKVSSDALPPDARLNKGYRFPADIRLNEQFLINKKNRLKLQPGMSLTANIKLRKVSYLNLLLSTFKNKTDSIKKL